MNCQNYFHLLLSRRDYSVQELERKGEQKGFRAEDIQEAIATLQNLGYQCDRRLTTTLIASGKGKYGKTALRQKCLAKGISPDLFEQVWQEQANPADDLTETHQLKAKLERKYQITHWHSLDPKTKTKVYQYLQYRGFRPADLLTHWQTLEPPDHSLSQID